MKIEKFADRDPQKNTADPLIADEKAHVNFSENVITFSVGPVQQDRSKYHYVASITLSEFQEALGQIFQAAKLKTR